MQYCWLGDSSSFNCVFFTPAVVGNEAVTHGPLKIRLPANWKPIVREKTHIVQGNYGAEDGSAAVSVGTLLLPSLTLDEFALRGVKSAQSTNDDMLKNISKETGQSVETIQAFLKQKAGEQVFDLMGKAKTTFKRIEKLKVHSRDAYRIENTVQVEDLECEGKFICINGYSPGEIICIQAMGNPSISEEVLKTILDGVEILDQRIDNSEFGFSIKLPASTTFIAEPDKRRGVKKFKYSLGESGSGLLVVGVHADTTPPIKLGEKILEQVKVRYKNTEISPTKTLQVGKLEIAKIEFEFDTEIENKITRVGQRSVIVSTKTGSTILTFHFQPDTKVPVLRISDSIVESIK